VDFDQISLTGGHLVLGGSSRLLIKFTIAATFPDATNAFWQQSHSWPIIAGSGGAANPGSSNFASIDGTNGSTAGTFSTSADANGNVTLTYTPAGAVTSPPAITSVFVDSGNLIFSGTNGVAGNPYTVMSSTNVALTLSSWTPEVTNTFGLGGVFSVTNPITPGVPQKFFTIRVP
jgi:hypothetical protein